MQLPDGICVLDETDRILHAAHHLYLHSFHRPPGLRVLVDFHVAFLGFRGDWAQVQSRALSAGLLNVLLLALHVSHQNLGTDIPAEIATGKAREAAMSGFAKRSKHLICLGEGTAGVEASHGSRRGT